MLGKAITTHRRPTIWKESYQRDKTKCRGAYLNHKVTLTRLGVPLLYAYDANTIMRRLRGLSVIPPLGPVDALLVRSCRFCHTFGHRKTVDVMFLNQEGDILKLVTLPPDKLMYCRRGRIVVQMEHGTAARLSMAKGHRFLPDDGRW